MRHIRRLLAALVMIVAASAQRPSRELTPFAREMLAAHNAVRAHVRVPPMRWSEKLAVVAQTWAETLLKRGKFEHQHNTGYGENLFEIRGGEAASDDVVESWTSEALDYDYRSNSCRSVCGHYTQIVWRSTYEVGCAVARGGGREVWVCEYSPPGNWVGQRPY